MKVISHLIPVLLSVMFVFTGTVAADEALEDCVIPLYSAVSLTSTESSVQYDAPLNFSSEINEDVAAIDVNGDEFVPDKLTTPSSVFQKDCFTSSAAYPVTSVPQVSLFIEKYSDFVTDEELTVLSKLVFGEANSIPSKMEKAAVVWTVLNRVDAGYGDILSVSTSRAFFSGYNENHPVTKENKSLCLDVLCRYYAEKGGCSNVGRVLPSDYLWFRGDGKHNYYRNSFRGGKIWDWSLPNPYV